MSPRFFDVMCRKIELTFTRMSRLWSKQLCCQSDKLYLRCL
jgi:hypothetical protein